MSEMKCIHLENGLLNLGSCPKRCILSNRKGLRVPYSLVLQGTVEVVNSKNEVVNKLGEGGHFGEIGLLIESKRTASIRATSYCDLYVLDKHDLHKALARFPHSSALQYSSLLSFPEQEESIRLVAETRIAQDCLREILPKFPV
jgi:CRP-like cAMP-binding protein